MKKVYSNVLIALLKGIVYSHQEEIWNTLILPESGMYETISPIFIWISLSTNRKDTPI